MEFWNESHVSVTLGGEAISSDDLMALVDAIDVSGLNLVPLKIDTAGAVIEAISQGQSLRLEAEDGNLGRISDFERAVARLHLACVITEKVPGATTIRSWAPGASRPTIVNLGRDGERLADAEIVKALLRTGPDGVMDYFGEIERVDHSAVPCLYAAPECVSEFRAVCERLYMTF